MWGRLKNYIQEKIQLLFSKKINLVKKRFVVLLEKELITQQFIGNFLETNPTTLMEVIDALLIVLEQPLTYPLFTREFRYRYRVETNTPCVESLIGQLNEIEFSLKAKKTLNILDVPSFNGLLDDWWLTQIETRVNTTHLFADLKRLCLSIKTLFAELDVSNQRYYLTFYSQVRRDLLVILVLLLKTKQ